MDISTLKEQLGDEKFSELESYVNKLIGQRDDAKNESISGRKGLKEKVTALETERTELLEKLGIDSFDDIADLADAKGQADAAKQFEAKVKRLERDLADANSNLEASNTKFKDSQRTIHLNGALSKHEWVARDVVESFLAPRLQWEGDELFYKTDGDRLISVADGVAELAKARPELLKPAGARGAGVRSTPAGGQDGKTMTRPEFDAASQAQRAEFVKSGGKVIDEAA